MNLAYDPTASSSTGRPQQGRRPDVATNGNNASFTLTSGRQALLAELHRMTPASDMSDNHESYTITINRAVITPRGLVIIRDPRGNPHILRFLLCVWDSSTAQPLIINYNTTDERLRFFEFKLMDVKEDIENAENLLRNVSKTRGPLDITIDRVYGRLPTGHVYPYWKSDITLRELLTFDN